MAQTIIVARHGESTFSRDGLVNGDPTVSCPLTDAGRLQAHELRRQLSVTSIELGITSEFERAKETARLALAGRGVRIDVHSGLNDPRAGTLESCALERYLEWHSTVGWDARPPGGGESQLDVIHRYVRAWEDVVALPAATVLVVCHALPASFALTMVGDDGPALRRRYELEVGYAVPHSVEARVLERGLDRVRRELASIRQGDAASSSQAI